MIVKNKNNNKKYIVIVAAALLFIIVSVAILEKLHVINFINNPTSQQDSPEILNSTKIDNSPATNEQISNGDNAKTGSNSDIPPEPTATQDGSKRTVQLTILSSNQNGSTLQIRVLVSAVENTGTCTLALASIDRPTVTKTTGTQALASTSTCEGFDVPISELSAGTWQARISYESPTLAGTVSQNVVIK